MSRSPAPPADSAQPDWDSTLDGLETALLAWEAWLADSSIEPPEEWTPPIGLAPLTPEHGVRAEALHRRYEEITALAASRLAQVRRERDQVQGPRAAAGYGQAPQSAYLDLEA